MESKFDSHRQLNQIDESKVRNVYEKRKKKYPHETQNFRADYSCIYLWQQPKKVSTPEHMWNTPHFKPEDLKIYEEQPKFETQNFIVE